MFSGDSSHLATPGCHKPTYAMVVGSFGPKALGLDAATHCEYIRDGVEERGPERGHEHRPKTGRSSDAFRRKDGQAWAHRTAQAENLEQRSQDQAMPSVLSLLPEDSARAEPGSGLAALALLRYWAPSPLEGWWWIYGTACSRQWRTRKRLHSWQARGLAAWRGVWQKDQSLQTWKGWEIRQNHTKAT